MNDNICELNKCFCFDWVKQNKKWPKQKLSHSHSGSTLWHKKTQTKYNGENARETLKLWYGCRWIWRLKLSECQLNIYSELDSFEFPLMLRVRAWCFIMRALPMHTLSVGQIAKRRQRSVRHMAKSRPTEQWSKMCVCVSAVKINEQTKHHIHKS